MCWIFNIILRNAVPIEILFIRNCRYCKALEHTELNEKWVGNLYHDDIMAKLWEISHISDHLMLISAENLKMAEELKPMDGK